MLNIKQKIYLVSGSILIISIVLIGGIVKFLILEIQKASTIVQEQNKELLILEGTDQGYLRQLESDYNNIKEDISLVESSILNENQAVEFFIELEKVALSTSNKLEIEASKFPLFALHLTGDFPSLMKFLGWLENGKYFIGVDSIQIRQFSERELPSEQAAPISGISSVLKIRSY